MKDPKFIIKWFAQHDGRGDEMRRRVGNAFWNYQHELAAWVKPDDISQQKAFDNLKLGVATFPCEKCSDGGLKYIESHPYNPSVQLFSDYVWNFHNAVNAKLGKPYFPKPAEMVDPKNCVPKYLVDEMIGNMDDPEMIAHIKELATCEA